MLTESNVTSRPTGTQLRQLRSRGRLRGVAALLGPAFVAAIAYVDPGNFATNFSAGATFTYTLAWVILAANLMAMLVQYLSAKIGVATGKDLPELCREQLPRAVSRGLWVQAELVAMATDMAEFIGAAIGLNLLFRTPLLIAGLITAVAAFAILALDLRGYRRFELAIIGLLSIVLLGFDSVEKAREWYDSPAYQAIKPLRQSSAKGRFFIVEGVVPQ